MNSQPSPFPAMSGPSDCGRKCREPQTFLRRSAACAWFAAARGDRDRVVVLSVLTPPLAVVAFDSVNLPGKEARLRAQVEAAGRRAVPIYLGNFQCCSWKQPDPCGEPVANRSRRHAGVWPGGDDPVAGAVARVEIPRGPADERAAAARRARTPPRLTSSPPIRRWFWWMSPQLVAAAAVDVWSGSLGDIQHHLKYSQLCKP